MLFRIAGMMMLGALLFGLAIIFWWLVLVALAIFLFVAMRRRQLRRAQPPQPSLVYTVVDTKPVRGAQTALPRPPAGEIAS